MARVCVCGGTVRSFPSSDVVPPAILALLLQDWHENKDCYYRSCVQEGKKPSQTFECPQITKN